MPPTVCPLCRSSEYVALAIGEPLSRTGRNVLCKTCGLIYHNPAESPEAMRDFYATQYSGEYSASEDISREMARERIHSLQRELDLGAVGLALEIGCAQGEFLHELSKQGIVVRGVEPSEQMSAHCRDAYGLPVTTGMYDDLPRASDAYDLICLFHVLEHVADPLSTLGRIRDELRPGGHLYLEVPTMGDCQLAIVFKTIHPTTFVPQTLEAMVRKAGFDPLMIKEQGYHLRLLAKPLKGAVLLPEIAYPDPDPIAQRVEQYISTRKAIIDNIVARLSPLKGLPGGAIYGAGLNTLDLDQVFPLRDLMLEAAYDNDPRKQGRTILDLPILSPDKLKDWNGSYLIISSYKFQQEIYDQCRYLLERGVQLIRLYETPGHTAA